MTDGIPVTGVSEVVVGAAYLGSSEASYVVALGLPAVAGNDVYPAEPRCWSVIPFEQHSSSDHRRPWRR